MMFPIGKLLPGFQHTPYLKDAYDLGLPDVAAAKVGFPVHTRHLGGWPDLRPGRLVVKSWRGYSQK